MNARVLRRHRIVRVPTEVPLHGQERPAEPPFDLRSDDDAGTALEVDIVEAPLDDFLREAPNEVILVTIGLEGDRRNTPGQPSLFPPSQRLKRTVPLFAPRSFLAKATSITSHASDISYRRNGHPELWLWKLIAFFVGDGAGFVDPPVDGPSFLSSSFSFAFSSSEEEEGCFGRRALPDEGSLPFAAVIARHQTAHHTLLR